jgi:hypothetical protein
MEKTLKAIDLRFFIGCPCSVWNGKWTSVIENIDIERNVIVARIDDSKGKYWTPDNIKPILRRFENLSRHEIEGLNKLWPNESIKRTTFGSIQLDAEIINYLTALNVDVFGWIDQGLAVDVAYNNH